MSKGKLTLVPSSASPARRPSLTDDLPEAAAAAVATFEKVLGGRKALLEHLASSPTLTPEIDLVLRQLADPANDRVKLSKICHQAGILPGELFAAFRSAKLAQKHIESLSQIADGLPAVTAALLKQALPQEVVCLICDGTGQVLGETKDKKPIVKACGRCQGHGKYEEAPNLDAQKLVLELAELLKRDKGGLSIVQQTQVNSVGGSPASDGGALSQLQRVIADHLYHRPPILPTEPVEGTVVADDPVCPPPPSSAD